MELKASLRAALDSYYSSEEKYGEDYAVSDLLTALEHLCDYRADR